MKAIVTVIGKDQVGIIAGVCTVLAEKNINVLDISQTVMQDYFTMIMMVDISEAGLTFEDLSRDLDEFGRTKGLSIRIQREDIFEAMHRI
ncbi:MAG: ACT domain-containing protein [Clostridia bacterium]|nr:ACT domain-containing protein [Clostridia bacterium]